MKRLGILVVEDEELARNRLARLVSEQDGFDLVGACGNCAEALRLVDAGNVDVLLLDVEMPGISGVEFSERLADESRPMPVIVFVTAYKHYAFDAFKVHAADYLLKPFDRARLQQALATARERVRAREAITLAEKIQSVVDAAAGARPAAEPKPEPGRFVVRDNGRFLIVRHEQVDWVEADGRDCILHCGPRNYRVDGPLADLVTRLNASGRFVQVSRSSVVNIDSIAELQEMFKGDLVAIMKGGQEVPVSRRYRSQVMERLAG